jgi:hypothetical protein
MDAIRLEKIGVEDIDPKLSRDRYKKRQGDEWRKGTILMRDFENQGYDTLQLKAGEWPDGKHLSIERMHSPFYGIDIGDKVIFRSANRSAP